MAASLAVLFVFHRRDIPRTYDLAELRFPREAIEDPVTFRAGWWVLALLLAGYLTPIGSLATLLWLHVLQGKGTKIT